MDFTLVTDALAFPEGPVILADGSVLVVEIRSGRLTRVAPDGGKTVIAELGGGPNGAAIGPDGAVYVCNNGGLEFFDAAPDLAVPGHARHTGAALPEWPEHAAPRDRPVEVAAEGADRQRRALNGGAWRAGIDRGQRLLQLLLSGL